MVICGLDLTVWRDGPPLAFEFVARSGEPASIGRQGLLGPRRGQSIFEILLQEEVLRTCIKGANGSPQGEQQRQGSGHGPKLWGKVPLGHLINPSE